MFDPDLSVFSNQKSLLQQQQLQQAFNQQKALQAQALQVGGIDAAQKANTYATQVLSAAASTGDQNAYNQGLAHLNQQGIDTSAFAPDVNSALPQLQAARLAQSPLGSLINYAGKLDANNLQAGIATGSVPADPNGSLHAVLSQGANALVPGAGALVQPVIAPHAPIIADNGPNTGMDMSIQDPEVAFKQASTMPQRGANETVSAYDSRLKALQSTPQYQASVEQAKSKAQALGKEQGASATAAVASDQAYNQILQNLDAIKTLAPNLPQQGTFLSAQSQADISQRLGNSSDHPLLNMLPGGDNQQAANNMNTFHTINEAQTINAIKNLAATGQIRMNQGIEKIIARGNLVDPNASPEAKIAQVKAIQAELANARAAAQNINAAENGGQTQQFTSPLQQSFEAAKGTLSTPSGVKYTVVK